MKAIPKYWNEYGYDEFEQITKVCSLAEYLTKTDNPNDSGHETRKNILETQIREQGWDILPLTISEKTGDAFGIAAQKGSILVLAFNTSPFLDEGYLKQHFLPSSILEDSTLFGPQRFQKSYAPWQKSISDAIIDAGVFENIVFCGYGLGGIFAQCACVDYINGDFKKKTNTPLKPWSALSLGSPASFDQSFLVGLWDFFPGDSLLRIYLDNDPLAFLSSEKEIRDHFGIKNNKENNQKTVSLYHLGRPVCLKFPATDSKRFLDSSTMLNREYITELYPEIIEKKPSNLMEIWKQKIPTEIDKLWDWRIANAQNSLPLTDFLRLQQPDRYSIPYHVELIIRCFGRQYHEEDVKSFFDRTKGKITFNKLDYTEKPVFSAKKITAPPRIDTASLKSLLEGLANQHRETSKITLKLGDDPQQINEVANFIKKSGIQYLWLDILNNTQDKQKKLLTAGEESRTLKELRIDDKKASSY